MPSRNTVSRSLHDLGAAAWFGGSLMGAVGVNGAALVARLAELPVAATLVEGLVEVTVDGDDELDALRDVIAELGLPPSPGPWTGPVARPTSPCWWTRAGGPTTWPRRGAARPSNGPWP